MFIITDKNNKIFHISETIGYETNGNIILDNGTQIGCFREVEVHEVDTIPNEVCTEKYCYTEADGFYENPNYVEPIDPNAEMEALKQQVSTLQAVNEDLNNQITEIQLALVEGGI